MMTIGGYRVVRTLGTGPHSAVLLGHPLAGGVQVALKVPHGDDRERALRELDALDAAASPTTVRLLDACTDERGVPVGILELLPSTPFAELLARGAPPRPAAAAGVLCALADTLDRLHSRGIVHGGLTATNVLVRDDGSPVLIGFGRAVSRGERPTLAARDDDPDMREDCAQFVRLVRAVFDSSGNPESGALMGSSELASSGIAALAERLRREIAPEPFLPATTMIYPVPAAVRAPRAEGDSLVPRRGRRRAARQPLTRRGLAHARRALEHMTAAARAVRPRFWVVGGLALGALLGALVLVPGPATDAVTPDPRPTIEPLATEPTMTPEPADVKDLVEPDRDDELSPAQREPAPTLSASPSEETDLVGAVRDLLDRRRSCLAERSLVCLREVSAEGSAARRDDEALVARLRSGEEIIDPLDGATGEIQLVDEYGGAALLAVDSGNTTAPVLVMKTGAGWRIRAYPGV